MVNREPLPPAPASDGYLRVPVQRWQQEQEHTDCDDVAAECAVALIYNGVSHAVMMASPTDLYDFALGFSLTEGIIERATELYDFEAVASDRGIELKLTISGEQFSHLKSRRRTLAGTSGCGLCGAESLQQAIRPVAKLPPATAISHAAIQLARAKLPSLQHLQALTGATHAAAWCLRDGTVQLLREDIGRHNALDKMIGAMAVAGVDSRQGFALVSSRASYELVHKVASARINTLVAISAPTSMAIELARSSGVALFGFTRAGRHVNYTPPDVTYAGEAG